MSGSEPPPAGHQPGHAWWTGLWRVSAGIWGATLMSFIASLVAARALGATSYGLVVLAVAGASLIAGILDLTLDEAVVHRGSAAIAADDFGRLRTILRGALIVDVAVGLVVAAAIALTSPMTARVFGLDPGSEELISWAAVLMLVTTINGTTGAALLLAGRADLQGYVQAIAAVVQLALFTALVVAGRATALSVLIAMVIAASAGAVIQGVVARRLVRRLWSSGSIGPLRPELRELLRFGVHSSMSTTISAITGHLLPLIIGRMTDPAAAAIYKVAQVPVVGASLATAPARSLLLPAQSRLAAEQRLHHVRRTIVQYLRVTTAIAMPAVLIGWVLMPWLIKSLYTTQFEAAVSPARVLLIPAAIMFVFGWAKLLPVALGRPELRTRSFFLVGTISVVGTVSLGGSAEAASWAVAAAYVIYAGIWLWLFERLVPTGDGGQTGDEH